MAAPLLLLLYIPCSHCFLFAVSFNLRPSWISDQGGHLGIFQLSPFVSLPAAVSGAASLYSLELDESSHPTLALTKADVEILSGLPGLHRLLIKSTARTPALVLRSLQARLPLLERWERWHSVT